MTDFTTNFQLALPNFNISGWHDLVNGNFQSLDALIFAVTGVSSFVGPWTNSTAYSIGQRVTDPDLGTLWFCLVDHNSPGSGSFETYRTNNPSHWQLVSAFPNSRGEWANDTLYAAGDMAYQSSEHVIAVCQNGHTSSSSPATIRDDEANWVFVFDVNAIAGDVEDNAQAAANSASAASASSTLAGDYSIIASGHATNAGNSRTAAEAARDKANEWAEKTEDSEVETGQYSALHHAAKAAASASSAANAAETALSNKITVSTNDPTGGSDGDIWFKVNA